MIYTLVEIVAIIRLKTLIGVAFMKKELNLLPYPKKVELGKGMLNIQNCVVLCEKWDRKSIFISDFIIERALENCSLSPSSSFEMIEGKTVIKFIWDASLEEEEYRIKIDEEGVIITHSTDRGRFYGAVTFCQLISKEGNVPFVSISDKPDYKIRGISDDISRGQISTMDNFKKVIRNLAMMKINSYFLYIEDMIRFDENPRIGLGRGAFTKAEIQELVAYARNYEIDIIPLFESLGHQDNMVKLPEYQDMCEGPGSFSFAPTDSRTLRLMERFYKELAEIFPSTVIFAGMDETNDIGTGKSHDEVSKIGYAKLYADYYNGLNKIAKKLGKKLWIYGTLAIDYPEALDLMDKDIVLVNYTFYGPNEGLDWWDNLYTYMPIIVEKGFEEVVSPGIWNWKMIFPNNVMARKNIAELNKEGIEKGCMGTFASSWCDEGGENLREYNYYSYAMQSEYSWNAKEPVDEIVVAKAFGQQFFGTPLMGEAIYNLGKAENSFGNLMYYSLWGDKESNPLFVTTPDEKGDVSQMSKLRPAATECADKYFEILDKCKNDITKNFDNVQYLSFAAKRVYYVMEYTKTLEQDASNQDFTELYKKLIKEMISLRDEFELLWKKSCRVEGLDHNLNRINNHINELKSKIN